MERPDRKISMPAPFGRMQERFSKSPEAARFIKFVLIGVLNTCVGYGTFFILSFFLNYLIALVVSHFIGVTNSYLWNKYWTFKARKVEIAEFVRFNSVYLVVLAANVLILWFLVNNLTIDPRVGQLFVLPMVTMISYFGHKYISFKSA